MAIDAGPLAAAGAALARGAWAEARSGYEAVLRDDPSAEALEGLAWTAWWTGDGPTVFDARERSYLLYLDEGNHSAAARMAIWLGTDSVDFRGELAVANGWLSRARRLLEGLEQDPEYGWLCVHEAEKAMYVNDTRLAAELGVAAGELGRQLGLTGLEMMGRATEGRALVTEGEVKRGMKALDEAAVAAIAGEFEQLQMVPWACCYVIDACERVRDFDRAAQWCRRSAEHAERLGIEDLNRLCRAHYAGVLVWRGSWSEAELELVDAVGPLGTSRPPMAAEALVRLADLRRRQGRLDEAAELFDTCEGHPLALVGTAELQLELGNPVRARELLEYQLAEIPEQSHTQRATALELDVRAAAALGDTKAARAVLANLRSVVDAVPSELLRASVSFAAGTIESAERDFDAARRSYEQAAYLFQRSGAPYESARAHLELGLTLLALGRGDHARKEFDAAAVVLRRLGAAHELARCEAASRRSRVGGHSPLTPRQREVLRLVADGLGDHGIAEQLVLSEHTVHRHVSNILAKLDCPSRSAAVAEALRMQLI